MNSEQTAVWERLKSTDKTDAIRKEYQAILFDIQLANSIGANVADVIKNRHDCGLNFLK